MWDRLSSLILRYRVLLLILVVVFTVFMGYTGRKVEMSYVYAELLPKKDSAAIDHANFIKTFGEEGNMVVLSIEDEMMFQLDHFNRWSKLCNDLKNLTAVEDMLSLTSSYQLFKDTEAKKFKIAPIFPEVVETQHQLDSLKGIFESMPLYRGYLYNDSIHAHLIVLTMNKDRMQTRERNELIDNIRALGTQFEKETSFKMRYSGLPYINVRNAQLIEREIYLFSGLALLICLVIFYLFFRSFKAMFASVFVVISGIAVTLGSLVLFDYPITILSGMIPPLIIIIGMTNSIYILNKYHQEFRLHQNKIKALKRVITRIGNAIFLTNLTTAIGFAAFITTSSDILKQFGTIASLNIMFLFVLSVLLIPNIFSFLPPPEERHIKHLKRKFIDKILNKLVIITLDHRKKVYVTMLIVVALSLVGMALIQRTGHLLDDIPDKDPIKIDVKYFEANFDGIMPLELVIDTKKPNGVLQISTLQKIDEIDQTLQQFDELSASLSIANVVKMARQAFYNGDERFYSIPSNTEKNFIISYATNTDGDIALAHSFVDSLMQKTRVSFRVKDIGTDKMDNLYNRISNEICKVFPADKFNVTITGSMVVFFRGNQYMVTNLLSSLALAIFVIALFMATMFRSARMVAMSLIPNIIPLLFTAAIMGYFNIPIKASTMLVFSVAFGISVDNTIHFLAKYRQELKASNWNIRESVIKALKETGISMMYTVTVLFFGFGIFAISKFGGTQALGILVSMTLLVAFISNLVLLPSLLLGLEKFTTPKSFSEPILPIYEDEEDDVDTKALEFEKNQNDKKN
ncbi:MAG TPA: MMPL family transporter [Prolixibacteraceae bacterium]|nr:MMPL family transporter [Prolixibacteraceae bacterium]